jgi:DNA-binding transcriptional regulator YdaS (Cro superfamily)
MKNEALTVAIRAFTTLKAFAEAVSTPERPVTYQVVQQWFLNRVPAEYCPTIERVMAGAVKCEQLRPDVDWAYIRSSEKHPPATIPSISLATPSAPPDVVAGGPPYQAFPNPIEQVTA